MTCTSLDCPRKECWIKWVNNNSTTLLSVGLNELHVKHLESWQQPVSIKCRTFSKINFYYCKRLFQEWRLGGCTRGSPNSCTLGGLNSGFKDIENWLPTFENCEISSETQILTSFSKDLWSGKLVFHNILLSIVLAALFIYSCNLFIYSVFS